MLLGYSLNARCNCESLLQGIRHRNPFDFRQACNSERGEGVLEFFMRKEYDFSKSRKNPYARQLRRQITIRLDTAAVDYFKGLAAELGMPYQNLINLYLRDCALQKRRPTIEWPEESTRRRLPR